MLPTLTYDTMLSDLLKRSYDQSLTVKVYLKTSESPIVGTVIGGSRSVAGQTVDYITGDGFYSYTFKLMSGYKHTLQNYAGSGNLTILVSDIENIEVIE